MMMASSATTKLGCSRPACNNKPAPGEPSFQKCGRCQVSRYCSRDCQTADWRAHKQFCAPLCAKTPDADARIKRVRLWAEGNSHLYALAVKLMLSSGVTAIDTDYVCFKVIVGADPTQKLRIVHFGVGRRASHPHIAEYLETCEPIVKQSLLIVVDVEDIGVLKMPMLRRDLMKPGSPVVGMDWALLKAGDDPRLSVSDLMMAAIDAEKGLEPPPSKAPSKAPVFELHIGGKKGPEGQDPQTVYFFMD